MRKLLDSAGIDVTMARDGHEALALLSQQPFAVLITDLEMPGMDGVELIGAVQARTDAPVPAVIAISGHESASDVLDSVQPIQGRFSKPWNDAELLARLRALLDSRPDSWQDSRQDS